ncbi:MAG: flavodoxin [Ruminococcus sp.]|nr:flavodoxin [Ruminococcus sp.]
MKKAIIVLLLLVMILSLAACGNSAEQTAEPSTEEKPEEQGTRVLVAYFSATNTTKGVAQHIAKGLNADIYEIVPEEPYTDADLNYNDNNSRTTIEMNDPDVRPAISGSVENMEQYDIVFLGYPIWWSEAPRIMSTFIESYDFDGKTIVPFCTSGGSGVGSSATNLEQLTDGTEWLAGKRLNGSDSQDTVMEWVNGLGLDFGD